MGLINFNKTATILLFSVSLSLFSACGGSSAKTNSNANTETKQQETVGHSLRIGWPDTHGARADLEGLPPRLRQTQR